MTALETVGVRHQFDAKNLSEANIEKQICCSYCRSTKQKINCNKCYINDTYKIMKKYFKNKEL